MAKMVFKMPYLIVGFVCQMPLLKNNRLRLLSSLTKLVYMFRDPLYDGAVFTRLELLQKHNFNIETNISLQFIKAKAVVFHSTMFFFLSLFTAVLWLF